MKDAGVGEHPEARPLVQARLDHVGIGHHEARPDPTEPIGLPREQGDLEVVEGEQQGDGLVLADVEQPLHIGYVVHPRHHPPCVGDGKGRGSGVHVARDDPSGTRKGATEGLDEVLSLSRTGDQDVHASFPGPSAGRGGSSAHDGARGVLG